MPPSDSGGDAFSPTELDEMQLWIVESLRGRRALPKNATANERAGVYLTGNSRLSPVEQLEIYRVQFWLRHTSSLIEDFPGVSGILGQADWEALVESYLANVALRSFTLRDLGADLAEHIVSRPETPHQALCVDMAKLEWAYVEVFDEEEATVLDADKLTTMSEEQWETVRFVTLPALRLLRADYPVAQLRKRLRLLAQGASDTVPIPEPEVQYLVLYRSPARELYYKQISAAAFEVLIRLQQGLSLVAACEQAASIHPQFETEIEEQIGVWFQDWGRRGFFVDIVQ